MTERGAQDCGQCRLRNRCWGAQPKHIMLNLLVCRLKLGIDVERTTRTLLQLLRPKLQNITNWVMTRVPYLDRESVFCDLQAAAILALQQKYTMSDPAVPLVWLFHPRYGGVILAAKKLVSTAARTSSRETEWVEETFDAPQEEPDSHEPIEDYEDVFAVINDGRTLSTAEYRVLVFSLQQGKNTKQLLHPWLAGHLGLVRQDVSRLFATAQRRVRRRLQGLPDPVRLPREEMRKRASDRSVSAVDLAVELGVSTRYVYRLRAEASV